MNDKNLTSLLIGTLLLVATGISHAETPLTGSWLMQTWESEEGSRDVQPGLWIFTGTHYSIMFVNGPDERPGYEGDQTDDHKIESYDTFTANTGRYVIDGNVLKTRAFVAKDTNYMGGWPDNETTYEFTIDGDTLTVKSVSFPVPFTATLRQVEGSTAPWDDN